MRAPGRIVTRAMLFEEVWNYRFTPKSNLIDVHLGRACAASWRRPGRRP